MIAQEKDFNASTVQDGRLALLGSDNGCSADTLRIALTQQFNPVGPVEQILVEELARRAAQMREFDDALATLRGQAAAALANVWNASGNCFDSKLGVARAGAIAADRCEALLRQGLAVTRGFYRALDAMRELRADHDDDTWHELLRPDHRFSTEQACYVYLARRHADGLQPCRRCGQSDGGSFIAARVCWECGRCKAQTGIRVGTCMQRSALPLTKWFAAIRALLLRPNTTPAEMATILKIGRLQTVRDMTTTIRRALAAENAGALLAGLDEVYLGFT
jgi:hypothetical protein